MPGNSPFNQTRSATQAQFQNPITFNRSNTNPNQRTKGSNEIFSIILAARVSHGNLLTGPLTRADQSQCRAASTTGNKTHGQVRFTQEGASVKVVATIEGLLPEAPFTSISMAIAPYRWHERGRPLQPRNATTACRY